MKLVKTVEVKQRQSPYFACVCEFGQFDKNTHFCTLRTVDISLKHHAVHSGEKKKESGVFTKFLCAEKIESRGSFNLIFCFAFSPFLFLC